jgi:formylglycine-generating enzyme required for sulfatase activity
MAVCRLTVLAFAALILTGSSSTQSDFIDLGKSRVTIVKIPAGTFGMGSDQVIHADDAWKPCPACPPRNEVEHPVHQVTISNDFWIGQFDVTQKQWQEVMGNNPSGNRAAGADAPVDQVSWKDVQSFLAKANNMQTRWTFRLPTEAEWEYAARAGSTGETYGPLDAIPDIRATPAARLIRLDKRSRMTSVFMTCWETSGSGARAGLARIPRNL